MVTSYRERGEALVSALQDAGFGCRFPEGAYYVLADFSGLSDEDSMTFGKRLTREAGVAPVPGGSFFSVPERGHSLARFVFCKRLDTLREAGDRLRAFAARG
jgi:aminotransferase